MLTSNDCVFLNVIMFQHKGGMLVSGHLTFDLNSKLFLPGLSIVKGFIEIEVIINVMLYQARLV